MSAKNSTTYACDGCQAEVVRTWNDRPDDWVTVYVASDPPLHLCADCWGECKQHRVITAAIVRAGKRGTR